MNNTYRIAEHRWINWTSPGWYGYNMRGVLIHVDKLGRRFHYDTKPKEYKA